MNEILKSKIIKNINRDFRFNKKLKNFLYDQMNNYLNAHNSMVQKPKYKVGENVYLKKGTLLRGEGASFANEDSKWDFIAKNGFISPDVLTKYKKNQKTPLTIPVWILQSDMSLSEYINLYSGATIRISKNDGTTETKLVPFNKIDKVIKNISNNTLKTWSAEQTKEIRFMPSLAIPNDYIGFIMNIDYDAAKPLIQNDIFNLSFDKKLLSKFTLEWFRRKHIYAKRDDFTTNREGAIVFGIPPCFIEGIIVGENYENNDNILDTLKLKFPNSYISNLKGIVIRK